MIEPRQTADTTLFPAIQTAAPTSQAAGEIDEEARAFAPRTPTPAMVTTQPEQALEFARLPTLTEALGRVTGMEAADPRVQAALIRSVTGSKLPTEAQMPKEVEEEAKIRATARGLLAQRPDLGQDAALTLARQHVQGTAVSPTMLPDKPLTAEEQLKQDMARRQTEFLGQMQGMDVSTPQGRRQTAEAARRLGLVDIATKIEQGLPAPQVSTADHVDDKGNVTRVTTVTDPVSGQTQRFTATFPGLGKGREPRQVAQAEILQSLGFVIAGRPELALPEHRGLQPDQARQIAAVVSRATQQVSPSLAAGVISVNLERIDGELKRLQAIKGAAKTDAERLRAETMIETLLIQREALQTSLDQFMVPGELPSAPRQPAPGTSAPGPTDDPARRRLQESGALR